MPGLTDDDESPVVVPVPVTAFRITIDGVALRGEIAGDGEPVVPLHARIRDRRVCHDAFGSPAERSLTVRDDPRGCGDSVPGVTHADCPFAHHTDLLAVIDHLGIERASLVGALSSASSTCRMPSRPASGWPGGSPPARLYRFPDAAHLPVLGRTGSWPCSTPS